MDLDIEAGPLQLEEFSPEAFYQTMDLDNRDPITGLGISLILQVRNPPKMAAETVVTIIAKSDYMRFVRDCDQRLVHSFYPIQFVGSMSYSGLVVDDFIGIDNADRNMANLDILSLLRVTRSVDHPEKVSPSWTVLQQRDLLAVVSITLIEDEL